MDLKPNKPYFLITSLRFNNMPHQHRSTYTLIYVLLKINVIYIESIITMMFNKSFNKPNTEQNRNIVRYIFVNNLKSHVICFNKKVY